MPSFSYTALDSSGSELKGTHQANDVSSAAQELRERGFRVLEVKESRGSSGFLGEDNFSDWYASQRSVSSSALIFFFRQMSFMLRSGLPVADALDLALTQVSSPRLKLTIRKMLADIRNGHALSVAMKKHHTVFPEMSVNLVMAGENTGDLDSITERIAVHLEKKAALKSQMINAMIYPSVVVIAAIAVAIFMIVKIIPKFANFLQGQGKALPPSTQLLIDISDYVIANGLWIIGFTILTVIIVLLVYQTRSGRLTIDSLLLRFPVIGPLLTVGAMAQMTWALSTLLRSGVTVFDALKIVSNLINNRVYANTLLSASKKILSGRDMSSSIYHRQFPPLILQMIAVGENTGSLDRVLQELGVYYEQLLENAIKRLSAMIEPAMILVIGAMVGFVYYAFFQALFSLVGGQ
jgi:type IV pilus assembly protein PilC